MMANVKCPTLTIENPDRYLLAIGRYTSTGVNVLRTTLSGRFPRQIA